MSSTSPLDQAAKKVVSSLAEQASLEDRALSSPVKTNKIFPGNKTAPAK
jgi:hypothetical protein